MGKEDVEEIKAIVKEMVGDKKFDDLKQREKYELMRELKNRGFTQTDIANALGLQQSTVSYYMKRVETEEVKEKRQEAEGEVVVELREEDVEDVVDVDELSNMGILPDKIRFQGEYYTPRELVLNFGKVGLDLLKMIALERAFDIVPFRAKNFGPKTRQWILMKYKTNQIYRDNPETLARLINEFTGMPPHAVQEIINIVTQVEAEYAPLVNKSVYLLNKAERRPNVEFVRQQDVYNLDEVDFAGGYTYNPHQHIMSPVTNPPTTPTQTPILPNAHTPPTPTPPNQPVMTKEDIIKILKEWEEEKKKVTIEDRVKAIEENIDSIIETIRNLSDQMLKMTKVAPKSERRDETELMIRSLQEKIEELESRLRENPKSEDPFDTLKKLEETYEKIASLMGKQLEPIVARLNELEKKVHAPTGQIDDKSLRLRELEIQKEIKAMESQNTAEAIKSIAKSLEQAARNLGRELGRSVALRSVAGHTQAVLMGDKVRAICPKCGAEGEYPATENVIKCRVCGTEIAKLR